MSIIERNVEFQSKGITCRGLYVRPDHKTRAPLIVLAHGLGGVYEMRLDAYARKFAEAGYAALTFDYRYFGRSDGLPRHLLQRDEQQADIDAAVDFGKTLEHVEAGRVVLWGTSLAGGHMIDVSARRRDITATIIQAPFTDGLASARATSLASVFSSAGFVVAHGVSRLVRGRPVLIPLAAPPFYPAMMTKPDVAEGVLALMPPGARLSKRLSLLHRTFAQRSIKLGQNVTTSDLPEAHSDGSFVGSVILPSGTTLLNGVSANFLVEIMSWRPGKKLKQLRTPIMVCACERDSVAPVAPTIAYAKEAATCELKLYPYQHFEIYIGEPFEIVTRDQIAFLQRVVPCGAARDASASTREHA